MNERLKRIDEELAAELSQIEGSLTEIDTRRSGLLADRERITASLTALRAGQVSVTKARGRSHKPCATKADVAQAVQSLIEQNGPCPEDDLIGLVEDRLREAGKSLSGFKLRYQGVREALLVETTGGRLGLVTTELQPRRTAG
ncbi:hypothetical protein Pla108_14390 [Botrimarina colliarenosi]|uniref:Uncharacterized protein n=1 Tax=Botrimarina colliarenosi TaxID=2528001 RepID=A0A5C6ALX5_9BACT|nr:hypothetical protein [Botrimarina colliarenosi]TWU00488.1 hypothetical protein Pla108_14390 [Botrimarina colliarenosi]